MTISVSVQSIFQAEANHFPEMHFSTVILHSDRKWGDGIITIHFNKEAHREAAEAVASIINESLKPNPRVELFELMHGIGPEEYNSIVLEHLAHFTMDEEARKFLVKVMSRDPEVVEFVKARHETREARCGTAGRGNVSAPDPEEIITVYRVLEYTGSREWVKRTLEQSYVQLGATRIMPNDAFISENIRWEGRKPMEVLKAATSGPKEMKKP